MLGFPAAAVGIFAEVSHAVLLTWVILGLTYMAANNRREVLN
jgi:hypothetical protein